MVKLELTNQKPGDACNIPGATWKVLAPMHSNRTTTYDKSGYVYLIRIPTGHYKIGRTRSLNKRIRHFTVTMPFDVDLVHWFPCHDSVEVERELHELFAPFRVRGEWFALRQRDVDFLCSIRGRGPGTQIDMDTIKHVSYLLRYHDPNARRNIDYYYPELDASETELVLS